MMIGTMIPWICYVFIDATDMAWRDTTLSSSVKEVRRLGSFDTPKAGKEEQSTLAVNTNSQIKKLNLGKGDWTNFSSGKLTQSSKPDDILQIVRTNDQDPGANPVPANLSKQENSQLKQRKGSPTQLSEKATHSRAPAFDTLLKSLDEPAPHWPGGPPKIAVVTILADHWFNDKRDKFNNHSLAELYMDNKKKYTAASVANMRLHRCDVEVPWVLNIPYANHFNKERCILHFLKNSEDSIEWVLFTDGDTWFYNEEARPLDMINAIKKRFKLGGNPKEPWPHIIMSQDFKNINAGVLLARVSNWTIRFFEDVLKKEESGSYSDQFMLIRTMKHNQQSVDDYKILVIPFGEQWRLQTYSPAYPDWLVHTPKCKAKGTAYGGEDNCLRIQLGHYCFNPIEPKLADLVDTCKELRRQMAFDQSFAWKRGGMLGWPLFLNPKWSTRSVFFAEHNLSRITKLNYWDAEQGEFVKGLHPDMGYPW